MLEAEGQTDIAAGVSGVVDEVFFREGDEVKPGTLLVTIDQARYQADAELARANAERAKANLDLSRDIADRTLRGGTAFSEEDRAKARGNLKIAEAEHLSVAGGAGPLQARPGALARAGALRRPHQQAPGHQGLVPRGEDADRDHRRPVAHPPGRLRARDRGPGAARAAAKTRTTASTPPAWGWRSRGAGPCGHPWVRALNGMLLERDYVLSGFDPEFELLAMPGVTLHGRIFYMSTVANPDTHMFEAKAEVLGWAPSSAAGRLVGLSDAPTGPRTELSWRAS